MKFDSDNLGDSQLNDFEDINDLEMEIDADEGDSILISVEARGSVRIEVWVGRDQQVQPAQQASAEGSEGRGFFVNAYRTIRKAAYTVRVYAERAAVTVIKIGKDIVNAAKRVGEPTKATCSFCTKVLLIAMVLAFHHLAIPVAKHAVGSYLLQHFQNAAAFRQALEHSLAGQALYFIYPAVEGLFDDLRSVPETVRNPLGTLARGACRKTNLCPQAA